MRRARFTTQGVAEKRDPIAEKQAAIEADKAERAKVEADARNALEPFAIRYHAAIRGDFKNDKHARQWLPSLRPVFDHSADGVPFAKRDVLDIINWRMRLSRSSKRRPRQASG
jgi:hypothetical protein